MTKTRWTSAIGFLAGVLLFLPSCLVVSDSNTGSGCYDDCYDYNVCETYCNAWECWDECWVETSCTTYCETVDEEPIDHGEGNTVEPQCYADIDCGEGEICVGDVCQPRDTSERGVSGLCQACETNANCVEEGALCIRLNFDQVSRTGEKVCTRPCEYNTDCPSGFSCTNVSDVTGTQSQCVPDADGEGERTCNPSPELECVKATDCPVGESCIANTCQGPEQAECTSKKPCADGFICRSFQCQPVESPECTTRSECQINEVCLDGECISRGESCVFNSDCDDVDGGAKCVDGQCVSMCSVDAECGNNGRCRDALCESAECRRTADCSADSICVDGFCEQRCASDIPCTQGYLCNNLGFCEADPNVECRSGAECARDEECSPQGTCAQLCGCNRDCPEGQVCGEGSGYCEPADAGNDPSGATCEVDCDCPRGSSCQNGQCLPE